MTTKQKKALVLLEQNRQLFLSRVDRMNNNSKIDIQNFIRSVQPYFKTVRSNSLFSIRFKGTNNFILIELLFGNPSGITFFDVKSTKHQDKKFCFAVSSHKELLQKFIKHDLI